MYLIYVHITSYVNIHIHIYLYLSMIVIHIIQNFKTIKKKFDNLLYLVITYLTKYI